MRKIATLSIREHKMPCVKSSMSHSSRFAPYEERARGEAPHPPSAEPELVADVARDLYWEDPVAEEVPYVAEEYEVECQYNDHQLDLPPLFEELSPRSDREGAGSPSSSTETADPLDHNELDDSLDGQAVRDEEVVEVDGEFEMNFVVSDDEDFIYDGPGGPQSPPLVLMYFGREECEEAGSPDVGAPTAAAREALRRVTRQLIFN